MPDLVPVRVRDCACPDTPHAETGDLVYLRPKPSLDLGIAATQAIQTAEGNPDVLTRAWFRLFVQLGTAGSNFLPEPWDPQPLLDDYELAQPVVEAASDLYAEILLRPLGLSLSTPSHGGRTGGSTSPRAASRRRSRA